MIFHENRLLADDSHEISYLVFFSKIKKDVGKFVVCCSCDWRFKGYNTTVSRSTTVIGQINKSPMQPGIEVIHPFPCSTQLSIKFILLINVKMPRIVGILTFITRINITSYHFFHHFTFMSN